MIWKRNGTAYPRIKEKTVMPREAAYRRFLVMGRDKICRRTAKVETSYSFPLCPEQSSGIFYYLEDGKLFHQLFL